MNSEMSDIGLLRHLVNEIDAALEADCKPDIDERHAAALRRFVLRLEDAGRHADPCAAAITGGRAASTPTFLDLMALVSLRIRRLAAQKGIALAHVADRAPIGRTTLWKLLDVNQRGPTDPRLSTLHHLGAVLRAGLDTLLAPATDDELAALGDEAADRRGA